MTAHQTTTIYNPQILIIKVLTMHIWLCTDDSASDTNNN